VVAAVAVAVAVSLPLAGDFFLLFSSTDWLTPPYFLNFFEER
jgi:hypothetical protein